MTPKDSAVRATLHEKLSATEVNKAKIKFEAGTITENSALVRLCRRDLTGSTEPIQRTKQWLTTNS